MKALALAVATVALMLPVLASAEHKSSVGGKVIVDSADANIRAEHGANCNVRHYHGELNGVADPDPNGCGHGEIKAIPHGDGNGETLPAAPAPGLWDSFVGLVKKIFTKENAENVVDVAAEANGVAPPFTVRDTVDIVREATPSIKEKTDNIKEYRETAGENDTLGIYSAPSSGGNADGSDTLSQKFFKWLNTWVK